jgi:phage terminase large subunit GpA-like protein
MCLMWASQVLGKSSIVEGIIGWSIDQSPCASLVIFPTHLNAITWAKNRLGPLIDRTARLRRKVERRGKDKTKGLGANTVVHKRYPNGWLLAGGSNSPANLRGHVAKLTIFDEVDGFPESSGDEGDVIFLTEQRSITYPDAFSIKTSTPTLKGASRIEKEYSLSDQRKWFSVCQKCRHRFVILWHHIEWEKEFNEKGKITRHLTSTAKMVCPACGFAHDENARRNAVKAGAWVATNPKEKAKRGYWANAFLVLLKVKRGYKSWAHWFADQFLAAKKIGPTGMRTFQNLILAEGYEVEAEKPPAFEMLHGRREVYRDNDSGEIILPEKVLFLVAGADVQQDRIECEILGIGKDEETWGICYKIFRGNTERLEIFAELDQWIQKAWKHPSGHELAPACACIDAGNKPDQVYHYVQRCAPRRVYAIKGYRGYVPNWVARSAGRNQRLFILKVDTPKESLYSRLRLIEHGPGYQHFPANPQCGYDVIYFQQLTAEVMRSTLVNGHVVRYFDLAHSGARNEGLDARIYAFAAKEILNPDYEAIIANLAVPPLNDWRFALPGDQPPKPTAEAVGVEAGPKFPEPPAPARGFRFRAQGWSRPY